MKKITSVVATQFLLLLGGCNAELLTRYEFKDPINELNERTLLAQFGRPDKVIEVGPVDGPRTYSFLYASAEGCVKTYTINAATKRVNSYRCIY